MPCDNDKTNKNSVKRRNRRRRRQRLKHETNTANKKQKNGDGLRQEDPTDAATRLWYETYQKMVKWHSEHQLNYWRLRAEQLQLENEALKRQQGLQTIFVNATEASVEDSETDSEAAEICADVQPIDEDYLKCMEITLKHRENLRKSREASEALKAVNAQAD